VAVCAEVGGDDRPGPDPPGGFHRVLSVKVAADVQDRDIRRMDTAHIIQALEEIRIPGIVNRRIGRVYNIAQRAAIGQ
jgi:hypothetical protein